MLHIKILSIGKTKEEWIQRGIELYTTRLKAEITIEWAYLKNEEQLIQACHKERAILALDPAGTLMSSEQFTQNLYKKLEQGGARLSFVIGGESGLPQEIKANYNLISLSPLTFTHDMARLLLIEQIYRAVQIEKGSPYHK
ncbi:MAG: rlmH [Chlamydiales bacterium]|jgi:23S rRNA (pseudouridine1915-N3)-methyltransferase|nr:rlmH [Chlamydiales bacterium]